MKLGERIKQRRLELGLSLADVGKVIGKDKSTVYKYENGDIDGMPAVVLIPLAAALQVSVGELLIPDAEERKKTVVKLYESMNEEGQKRLLELGEVLLGNPSFTIKK